MRVLLVANPASGSGRGLARGRAARQALEACGAAVEPLETSGPGDARHRLDAGAWEGFDRIVACGGDGLVSEVVAGLSTLEAAPPLGIVAAGRGNDLARSLGLPLGIEAAARLAVSGSPRAVDLGEANGRPFCTVACCGLDAEVSRRARRSRLPLPGPGTYVVELLRALGSFRPVEIELEHDGGVLRDRAVLVAVANTAFYGGGFHVAPGARTDDGLLDACVIRARSRAAMLALFPTVLRGRHVERRGVSLIRSRSFRLTCRPPLAIEADGEPLAATPVEYRALPGAIHVVGAGA